MGLIFLLSGGLTFLHFVLLSDVVLSSLVFLVSFLFFLGTYTHLKKETKRNQCFHQTYFFLLDLIMNLSLKGSLHEAYADTKKQLNPNLHKVIEEYETNQTLVTLTQLHAYFSFPIYQIAIQMMHFYEEKGGQVLVLFDRLLKQLRLEETRRQEKELAIKRAGIQFIVLWFLNLTILGVAYVALSSLFLTMAQGVPFQYFLTGFFMYISFSSWMWVKQHVHDA